MDASGLLDYIIGASVLLGVLIGFFIFLMYWYLIKITNDQKRYRYNQLCFECREKQKYKHNYPMM